MLAFGMAVAVARPVAVTERTFEDPVAGAVPVRIHVPAGVDGAPDRDGGPYPLAVVLHGWLGQAWMYDGLAEGLAGDGYVVVALDTETGVVLDLERFADDAVAALHGVTAAAADPTDPLAGLVDDGAWTALGHSMGGATLPHVLALEPRIATAVAFMPYRGYPQYYAELSGFEGSFLLLSGGADTTAPVPLQADWFDALTGASRALWVTVPDLGHTGVTDLAFGDDPMPDAEQNALLVGWARAFLAAEHGGDEARWEELFAAAAAPLDGRLASRSRAPVLWARPEAGVARVGVAGWPGAEATVLVDGVPAATLSLPDGVGVAEVPVPEGGRVTVWAEVGDGAETREVVWGEEAAGTGPAGEGTAVARPAGSAEPEAEAEVGAAPRGCASAPGGSLGAALVALAALRRRTR